MNAALIVIVLMVVAFALIYLSKKSSSQSIDPKSLKQQLTQNPGVIIDVRTPREYDEGHLKKANYNWDVTSGEFEENLKKLDKNQNYYLYCRSGSRSGKAVDIMKKNGFENVYNAGGFRALLKAGFEEK